MKYTQQLFKVNGTELNVVIVGEGPPVLLVHGFPDTHQIWRHQMAALVKAGYQVIAPDTRGCGQSAMLPKTSDYHLQYLVGDLIALLDHLKIDKVRLAGHDWGAVISWHLCMAHPERVVRYAALSVGHPTAYARAPLIQKIKGYYVLLLQFPGLTEWFLRAFNWRFFKVMSGNPPEMPEWIAHLERPGRLTAAVRYYRANLALILPTVRPSVHLSVMGIYSSKDIALCEQQMVDSARYVNGTWRYERLDGIGHWMTTEAPEAVNALLIDFFK